MMPSGQLSMPFFSPPIAKLIGLHSNYYIIHCHEKQEKVYWYNNSNILS